MADQSPKALIEEGQALVHSLATKIARNLPMRVDLDDLIAYGQVGLAEAARQFDPSRGTQFTTFAYYRIRGAIYDGVSKMSWTSRARYARYRFEEMTNETLAQAHDSNPTDLSLAEEARWFRNVTEKLAVIQLVSVSDDGETG
ncbi:MAG: sigma-70 family RNA polymerase sigma factor, partial [Planctomycetia bacterium]|nr:sigma-70 family RNA polymerase sigma factor [Planctomycetia bacterium]